MIYSQSLVYHVDGQGIIDVNTVCDSTELNDVEQSVVNIIKAINVLLLTN